MAAGRAPVSKDRGLQVRSGWDERALVDGLETGDRAAIAEFLERTHHAVYAFACRLSRYAEDREDWTHEVLLGLLNDVQTGKFVYRRPGSFWAWFRKRAHYRLLDAYRRRARRERREAATLDDPEAAEPEGGDLRAELERAALRNAIEQCLDRIPNADHRQGVMLLLLEDWTYEEIAREMVAPLNTVRSWIRRGRIALRECLAARLGLEASS